MTLLTTTRSKDEDKVVREYNLLTEMFTLEAISKGGQQRQGGQS